VGIPLLLICVPLQRLEGLLDCRLEGIALSATMQELATKFGDH
jgi:hypothetical protein